MGGGVNTHPLHPGREVQGLSDGEAREEPRLLRHVGHRARGLLHPIHQPAATQSAQSQPAPRVKVMGRIVARACCCLLMVDTAPNSECYATPVAHQRCLYPQQGKQLQSGNIPNAMAESPSMFILQTNVQNNRECRERVCWFSDFMFDTQDLTRSGSLPSQSC